MLSKFRLAHKASLNSNYKYKVGATVCRKNIPLYSACNILKTHPKYANPNNDRGSIHAEIRALLGVRGSLRGCDIYVYRETRKGAPALARPCDDCLSILEDVGIRYIYYTTQTFPWWERERLT